MAVKIRVGLQVNVVLGPGPARSLPTNLLQDVDAFWSFIGQCEQLGFDSLWFSQRVTSATPEPMATMAAVAARTTRLKLGTSVLVLSAYNPVIAAKALATIDVLSSGRVFPAVSIGSDDACEIEAIGVPKRERGKRTDEAITLMKRLWAEERVTFHGEYFRVTDVTLWPRPVRKSGIDLWAGGHSPGALRRVGRFCDGWIPAYVTPEEIGSGIRVIQEHAEECGRTVPDDHFGALVAFTFDDGSPDTAGGPRSETAPDLVIRGSHAAMLESLRRYVDVGVTKFILTPVTRADLQLERIRAELAAPLEAVLV